MLSHLDVKLDEMSVSSIKVIDRSFSTEMMADQFFKILEEKDVFAK
jgi:hypothetical protein